MPLVCPKCRNTLMLIHDIGFNKEIPRELTINLDKFIVYCCNQKCDFEFKVKKVKA